MLKRYNIYLREYSDCVAIDISILFTRLTNIKYKLILFFKISIRSEIIILANALLRRYLTFERTIYRDLISRNINYITLTNIKRKSEIFNSILI